jgi:hypothetical protein
VLLVRAGCCCWLLLGRGRWKINYLMDALLYLLKKISEWLRLFIIQREPIR